MDNFEDIKMVQQPKELKIKLYPHQLASIYKMEKMEREKKIKDGNIVIETTVGINGDITGYGKTPSMVALILRNKMEWDGEEYIYHIDRTVSDGLIRKKEYKSLIKTQATLVLASQSIINQWESEFKKSPLTVYKITTNKHIDLVNIDNWDVILVSPTMYNNLIIRCRDIAWKRFIFDEPGHMKVSSMRKIVSGFMWLVTATPHAMVEQHRRCKNSFMRELVVFNTWTEFERIFLKYLLVKNNEEFIKQSFSMPLTNHIYHECFQPIIGTLGNMVTGKVKEMILAGNIFGAITALGGKKTKNIVQLVKNKKQLELEEIRSKIKIYKLRDEMEESKGNHQKIIEWSNREKEVIKQINELDQRYRERLKDDCNICMEKITNPVMEPNCQNIFCGKCMLKWLENKKTCPLCRDYVLPSKLICIKSEEENVNTKNFKENKQNILTKENTVIKLISDTVEGKFIIFSSWDESFHKIRNILKENNIGFIEIKGSVDNRKKELQKFKDGIKRVIFLNSKYNGSGINLQDASDVIVYHKMNTDTMNQILGRANRIGRVESLNVHHLIIK